LRALTRHTRHEQRSRHGEYVERAGLAHLDPGTLLGGLCELATLLTDPACMVRWTTQGDARLAEHRRRRAHRRRLASSGGGGTSAMKTKSTQS
jgi:hypothetical protein